MYSNPGTDEVQSKNDYYICETYSLSKPINLNQFWDWKIFLLLTVTNSKQLNWIIKSLNAMEHWVFTWYQRSLTQKPSHFTSTLRTEQRCIKPKKNPAVRYAIHTNLTFTQGLIAFAKFLINDNGLVQVIGKPWKSWNLRISFSRPSKSWKLKFCLLQW